jgi:DNA mismatch repair protein MutH
MLQYDIEDKHSIIQYAKQFIGKSIQSEFGEELEKLSLSDKDKGQLGKVIEKLYFKYEPNSNKKADFEEAGLELKSGGLKQLKNKEYRAKERLVLSLINYFSIVNQNFDNDFLKGKNGHLLLIFYLYVKGLNQLASEIKLVGDWKYPAEDVEIIRQDWLKIQQKISDGRAHELSEGDTFYLGACTKGANASSVRKQPFSDLHAKQRAFSLKPGYVNHIISKIAGDTNEVFGKIITNFNEIRDKSLEEIVIDKFKEYYGKSILEISEKTGVVLNIKAKNFYSQVTHAILSIELDKVIEEFEKADIVVKTIRVEENNKIVQSVSFPAFKFEDIYNEHWIKSEFKEIIERKFLFIFFKSNGETYILNKAKFWNIPLNDIYEVRKVWLETKRIIQNGRIFKDYDRDKHGRIKLSSNGNRIKRNNFPKMRDNPICHVRPHGRDSKETFPLPVEDKILKVKVYSKQCFWLKNTYIRDEIYLK